MDKHSLLRTEDEEDDLAQYADGLSLQADETEVEGSCIKNLGLFRVSTKSWLVVFLAINTGLMLLLIFQVVPKTSTSIFNGETITTHFGARTEYMSLEHSYDIFWEELLINKSHWPALAFGKDHDKWLGRATITMLVLLRARDQWQKERWHVLLRR